MFKSKDDPYRDRKKYHMAHLMSEKGVSALCFTRPRPINLSVALWTIREEAVTCSKCLALIAKKRDGAGRGDSDSATPDALSPSP